MSELHFFDPNDEVSILERKLPHWSQPGVVCFITIRTHDSFAKETLQRFHADRRHWLRRHGINPDLKDWREKLKEIGREPQKEFYKRGASGRFWQQDGFDHLVRSLEQYEHFQGYIANNPIKALLKPDTYRHYSK